MAITQTPRLGINKWGAGTDPVSRAQFNADHDALELLAAIDIHGNIGDRPAAGIRGRYFHADDTGANYRDNGAAWENTLVDGSITLAKLAAAVADSIHAIGDVKWQVHDAAPSAAWVVADGASVLRAGAYAALYALVGTAFGSVDGTHFNLPNLVGARIEGVANNAARAQKAADSHSHTKSGSVSSANAAHSHGAVSGGQSADHNHGNTGSVEPPNHDHNYLRGTAIDQIGTTGGVEESIAHVHSTGTTSAGHTHSVASDNAAHTHGDNIAYAAGSVGSVTKLVPFIKIA